MLAFIYGAYEQVESACLLFRRRMLQLSFTFELIKKHRKIDLLIINISTMAEHISDAMEMGQIERALPVYTSPGCS